MILPDFEIERLIQSHQLGPGPFDLDLVQPASLDVRLGEGLLRGVIPDGAYPINATRRDAHFESCKVDECLILQGSFYLATTLETVRIPNNIVGELMGKSSIGRLGLSIHVTAGLIDPGFCGQITLEIVNSNPHPVQLEVGIPIAQIVFTRMSDAAKRPYGDPSRSSRYQGQGGATAPK